MMLETIINKIKNIEIKIQQFKVENENDLEQFRLDFISKKGLMSSLMEDFNQLPNEQKKSLGQQINLLRELAQSTFKKHIDNLNNQKNEQSLDIDVFLPPIPDQEGSLHPVTMVKNRMIQIFERQGFNVEIGPEIDNDWNNFTALNFPENHPARDMQDTYFIEKNPDILLRTHTSNVQIRLMQNGKPPFRSVMPGRVFRNEVISSRGHCFFHQMEGLFVDKNVSFKDLKQTIYYFAKEFFGKNTKIRLRPSFFPFTEPSAEIDVSCFICNSKGCKLCKHTGWVEIAGCGMVDPNVLINCNIDPKIYSGFAFGFGLERIAMLKYQIDDIRLLFENDVRFLSQFQTI